MVRFVEVYVSLAHSFSLDCDITLVSPFGTRSTLQYSERLDGVDRRNEASTRQVGEEEDELVVQTEVEQCKSGTCHPAHTFLGVEVRLLPSISFLFSSLLATFGSSYAFPSSSSSHLFPSS